MVFKTVPSRWVGKSVSLSSSPFFSHCFLGVKRQRGYGCDGGELYFFCPKSSISHAYGYGCWVMLTQCSRAYGCWVVPLRRGLRKHITRLHDQAGFLNNNVEKAIGLDFFPNDRPSSKVCKAYVCTQTSLFRCVTRECSSRRAGLGE